MLYPYKLFLDICHVPYYEKKQVSKTQVFEKKGNPLSEKN